MGCCASTTCKAHSASHHSKRTTAPHPPSNPLLEEETVKEVLSETPTPQLKLSRINDEPNKTTPIKPLPKIQEDNYPDNSVHKKPSMIDIEEVSEINSTFSESLSTTSLTENRDDYGELVVDKWPRKFKYRSFSGDLKIERVVGNSPAIRSEPSPSRVRSVPGRERRGFVAEGQKWDGGESSGRTSRSPAARSDNSTLRSDLGRSPSARRIEKSPCRGRSDLPEPNRKVEDGKRENMWLPTTNESLENPLVSLECFIFL